jgi:hypothetical protein
MPAHLDTSKLPPFALLRSEVECGLKIAALRARLPTKQELEGPRSNLVMPTRHILLRTEVGAGAKTTQGSSRASEVLGRKTAEGLF